MRNDIQPGDHVAYSAKFLRSIGCQTGPMPFARGRVVVVRQCSGMTLATVEWRDPAGMDTVNVANLVRTADMALECIE
jgi:hypothetical protein